MGAGWAHLVNNLGSEPHDRGTPVEVGAYRVGEHEMGFVRDGRRVVAAMRLSPRFNHWLASDDELEVYSDDWMRVLSSVPSTVDRIQILTLLQPTRATGHLSDDVLGAAEAAIATRSRQITTYLIVRLKDPVEDDETAGRIAHEALQHLGGQLPQELVAAEILSPLDWKTLLANCSAIERPGAGPMGSRRSRQSARIRPVGVGLAAPPDPDRVPVTAADPRRRITPVADHRTARPRTETASPRLRIPARRVSARHRHRRQTPQASRARNPRPSAHRTQRRSHPGPSTPHHLGDRTNP